jgi:hypothetical protein
LPARPRSAILESGPVVINGAPMSVADLVARTEALHSAFTDHVIEIVDRRITRIWVLADELQRILQVHEVRPA